jgi:hypothetical protein
MFALALRTLDILSEPPTIALVREATWNQFLYAAKCQGCHESEHFSLPTSQVIDSSMADQ